ncbi:MAG: O-antigen ligase family protein [Thermoleophilia bacterium]|nr:O-antigen ligase family protein [Thermoleophilia bacterium]
MSPTPPTEHDPWKTAGRTERADADSHEPTVVRRRAAPPVPVATDRGPIVSGIVIIVLLCAVCVGLAFQSGGYSPRTWLTSLAGVAALALVVSLAGPTVSSGRFQKVLLCLFGLQTAWTAASLAWASSTANAWEEANRTLFFAIVLALVFAAVRWSGRRGLRALVTLLIAVVAAVALYVVISLAVSVRPEDFFVRGRLNAPIGYFNALSCFLMIGFWLALGLASAPTAGTQARAPGEPARERFPRFLQPVLLAAAVLFVEVALFPQSRGALWTFFLALPFFVILSPNRFRALTDLVIVVAPVVIFWDRLNGFYAADSAREPLSEAVGTVLPALGYSVAVAVGLWIVSWLVERWLAPLSRAAVRWVGIALVVVALLGAGGGLIWAHVETGGLGGYVQDRWDEVVSDAGTGNEGQSRFTAVGLNGRLRQWEVAAAAFVDEPLLGIGAQNFEIYWYEHRADAFAVKQPHSQPMQLLAELGAPGLVLWLAFVIGAMIYAGRLRFRPLGRSYQAVVAAMMTAVISWFIHSSADWIWQMTATTLPAIMLLGGLVAATGKGPDAVTAEAHSWRGLTRPVAALLAVLAIVSAVLPYFSIRYCEMAARAGSLEQVTAKADTAAALDPTSVLPFSVRAGAHRLAALAAAEGSPEQIEQFKLEAQAWAEAIDREPDGWLYYYNAARAHLAVRDAVLAVDPNLAQESEEWARIYLEDASRLNPLSNGVRALQEAL